MGPFWATAPMQRDRNFSISLGDTFKPMKYSRSPMAHQRSFPAMEKHRSKFSFPESVVSEVRIGKKNAGLQFAPCSRFGEPVCLSLRNTHAHGLVQCDD